MSTFSHLWMPGSECSQDDFFLHLGGRICAMCCPRLWYWPQSWCLFVCKYGISTLPLCLHVDMCLYLCSSCVHVCLIFFSYKDTSHIGLRPNFYMTSH